MSHYKTLEQIEFAELFTKLEAFGYSAKQVAKELKLSPGTVSYYLSGERSPRPLTMDAMRQLVSLAYGGNDATVMDGAMALREMPVHASENWRERAIRAEQELAQIKDGLRKLLAPTPNSNEQNVFLSSSKFAKGSPYKSASEAALADIKARQGRK